MQNTFVLACRCGCGESIICYTSNANLYMSFCCSYYNIYQRRGKRAAIKRALHKLPLATINLSKPEIETFIAYLKGLSLTDRDAPTNEAAIRIDKPTNDVKAWSISLMSRMKPFDLRMGKVYHCYELMFNATQCHKLAARLARSLARLSKSK